MRFKHLFTIAVLLIHFQARLQAQFLNWQVVNILDDAKESGSNPDFIIDAAGGFHLTCWNMQEDKLQYLYKAPGGASWSREYVNPGSANGYKSAITLSPAGVPHVAFLENAAGVMQMRYAYRNGTNSWIVEAIPGDPVRGWGGYGPTSAMVQTERIKNSVDIELDASGSPQIIFFDGWWQQNLTPPVNNCTGNYGLKPWQAKKIGGNWFTKKLGVEPAVHINCGVDSMLISGDRVGEYASLIKQADGKMRVFTMGRFSEQILQYETTVDDTTWLPTMIDKADSMLGFSLNYYGGDNHFFTFEGVSSNQTPNGFFQVANTSSMFYGENFCCLFFNGMAFSQIDTLGNISNHYFPFNTYRNHTSIASEGNDSLYLVYSDLTTDQVLMMETTDRGASWSQDTVLSWATTNDLKARVWNDSLFVAVYEGSADQLWMMSRHLAPGSAWQQRAITQSQNRGASLDAVVVPEGSDTVVHLAYTDEFRDELYYARAEATGNWNYVHELVDSDPEQISAVSVCTGPIGQPVMVYSAGQAGDLKIAVDNAGAWSVSVIDSAAEVSFTQISRGLNDSLYVVFFDGNEQALKYARKPFSGGSWLVDYIDSINSPAGAWPSLVIDPAGRLHVSYFCESIQALFYATRSGTNGQWTIDSLFSILSSSTGKFSSIDVTSSNLPKIAFLDEVTSTVWLAEKDVSGNWDFTAIDSTQTASNGRPIDLQIDQFDNPWIAFNSRVNYDLVALKHRDTTWHPVSINSTGHIAQSFSFSILGADLFLIGKKTELGNTGLAMLYGPSGLFISRNNPGIPVQQFGIWPNPTRGSLSFAVEMKEASEVKLRILNLQGVEIACVEAGRWLPAGQTLISWDASQLAPGLYLAELSAGGSSTCVKLMRAE